MAIPAFIARHLGEQAYRRRIGKGLTEAHGRAGRRDIELSDLRAVVFSDHHRGVGDGADDFRRCEPAYCAALGWYLEQGYELWLLGDVEELWENSPRKVMKHYEDVLALERQFGDRLRRFYGNHDMEWRSSRYVEKFLARHVPGTAVEEAVRIVITRSGEPLGTLFLVHGHQGTTDSGNLLVVPFSRLVVRLRTGRRCSGHMSFASTSPASDDLLRGQHDRRWRRGPTPCRAPLVIVAGHASARSSPTGARRTWRPGSGRRSGVSSRRRPAATTSRRRAAPASGAGARVARRPLRSRWRSSGPATSRGLLLVRRGDVTAPEFSASGPPVTLARRRRRGRRAPARAGPRT